MTDEEIRVLDLANELQKEYLRKRIVDLIESHISINEDRSKTDIYNQMCSGCGYWDGSMTGDSEYSECTCNQNDLLETIIKEIKGLE